MRRKSVAFPESVHGLVTVDNVELRQFRATVVGTPMHGFITIEGFGRVVVDGVPQVRSRHVAILRGRRALLDLARSIIAREEAHQRRVRRGGR